MIVNTPDGPVSFPDNMSEDDVKGVLQKKYGAPAGDSSFFDQVSAAPNLFNQADDNAGRRHAAEVVSNLGRAAANTFGVGDNLVAGWRTILPAMYPSMFGGNASGPVAQDEATMGAQFEAERAKERAKTAASNAALGPVYSTAANVAGGIPLGLAGVGSGVARATAPTAIRALGQTVGPYVARLISGPVEGVTANLISDAGRGESPDAKSLATSGVLGLFGSLLGGKGTGETPAIPPHSDVVARQADALTALKAPQFSANDAIDAYKRTVAGLSQNVRGRVSPKMREAMTNNVNEIGRAGSTGADDINGYARGIFAARDVNALGQVNDADHIAASALRDNLTVGPKSFLATAVPTSPHNVGEAAQLNDAFNMASAKVKDSEWLGNTNINKAPAEAAARLNEPGMLYDPATREAVTNLAARDTPPRTTTSPWWGAIKAGGKELTSDIFGKNSTAAIAALTGNIPAAAIIKGVQAAGSGLGEAASINRNNMTQRLIDAARVANATGNRTSAYDMLPRPYIRNIIRGSLAGPEANPPDPQQIMGP